MGGAQLRLVSDTVETPMPTLAEAFVQYGGFVTALALKVVGSRELAEDIRQDVFIEAQRGWSSIRNAQAVRGWLGTVTVRVARKKLKKRRLFGFLGFREDYNDVTDPNASAEDKVLLAEVYAVLDGVKVEERIAWTLRHVHGETLPRVAELCDCSLATAKRRISAADKKVRQGVDS